MTIHNIAVHDRSTLGRIPHRYPRRQMSARTRVLTIAGLASALAVAAIVGATLLQSDGGKTASTNAAVTKPRAGAPPLILDLGVRDDAEARALGQASALYHQGHRAQAGRIFARYSSLP